MAATKTSRAKAKGRAAVDAPPITTTSLADASVRNDHTVNPPTDAHRAVGTSLDTRAYANRIDGAVKDYTTENKAPTINVNAPPTAVPSAPSTVIATNAASPTVANVNETPAIGSVNPVPVKPPSVSADLAVGAIQVSSKEGPKASTPVTTRELTSKDPMSSSLATSTSSSATDALSSVIVADTRKAADVGSGVDPLGTGIDAPASDPTRDAAPANLQVTDALAALDDTDGAFPTVDDAIEAGPASVTPSGSASYASTGRKPGLQSTSKASLAMHTQAPADPSTVSPSGIDVTLHSS